MADSETADSTNGLYRRIYAGFLVGTRINSVSWQAEAWFWRLQALADDFGNLPAQWRVLAVTAAPKRFVSPEEAAILTAELLTAGLIETYRHDGDPFIHITDFTRFQPAGRNGRRIRRVPGESESVSGNPGESGGIQFLFLFLFLELMRTKSKRLGPPPLPLRLRRPKRSLRGKNQKNAEQQKTRRTFHRRSLPRSGKRGPGRNANRIRGVAGNCGRKTDLTRKPPSSWTR